LFTAHATNRAPCAAEAAVCLPSIDVDDALLCLFCGPLQARSSSV
jgi:hypothetical protein